MLFVLVWPWAAISKSNHDNLTQPGCNLKSQGCAEWQETLLKLLYWASLVVPQGNFDPFPSRRQGQNNCRYNAVLRVCLSPLIGWIIPFDRTKMSSSTFTEQISIWTVVHLLVGPYSTWNLAYPHHWLTLTITPLSRDTDVTKAAMPCCEHMAHMNLSKSAMCWANSQLAATESDDIGWVTDAGAISSL